MKKKTFVSFVAASLIALVTVGCAGGGNPFLQPVSPIPSPPTPEEVDKDGDGTITKQEAEEAKAIYDAMVKDHLEKTDVEPATWLENTIGVAGDIGSVFFGGISETVKTSLLALLGFYARSENRKKKAAAEVADENYNEAFEADRANKVLIANIRDLLATVEKSPVGEKGVAEIKELLRKKQIDAGVYDRIKAILLQGG